MSADYAHATQQQHVGETTRARSVRARIVLAIGPATVVAGFAWAIIQPYRLTVLHPHGLDFWWLVSEPPLYVVLAGLVFRFVVAPSLAKDIERLDGHGRMPPTGQRPPRRPGAQG
jgi:hypothetical protein